MTANFSSISKLPFLSKVLEKVVCKQLQTHLDTHGILEKFKSGFKSRHSTELALAKVFNDLLLTLDSGHSEVLILLDLTAAFDTVDHNILSRLKWFPSYQELLCTTLSAGWL